MKFLPGHFEQQAPPKPPRVHSLPIYPTFPEPEQTIVLQNQPVDYVTTQDAEQEIAIANAEVEELSARLLPLRAYMVRLHKRLVALEHMKHRAQIWILEEEGKINDLPFAVKFATPDSLAAYLRSLSPGQLEALQRTREKSVG